MRARRAILTGVGLAALVLLLASAGSALGQEPIPTVLPPGGLMCLDAAGQVTEQCWRVFLPLIGQAAP